MYTYWNGDKYEGQWENGQKHGRGEIIYANGDRSAGKWEYDDCVEDDGIECCTS